MKQKGRNSSNSTSGGQKPARASIGPMAWAGTAHSQSYASTPQAMAKAFNASVPMRVRQDKHEQGDDLVRADQPEDLRAALKAGLQVIHPAVLRGNAVLLLEWFEHVIIEHILERQADDKALAYLTRRDTVVEAEDPGMRGKRYGGGRLAKSSLIGRDPFGEKKLLPAVNTAEAKAQQAL